MAPEYQLSYLEVLSSAAKMAARQAQASVSSAELLIQEGAQNGWSDSQLDCLRQQRLEATQKLEAVTVYARLYLAALKEHRATLGPAVAAWDEGMR